MSDIYAMQASKNEIKESIKMIAITQEEVNKASEMIGKFVGGYSKKDKGLTDEVWLAKELQSELPDKSAEELCGLASEIMESVMRIWSQSVRGRMAILYVSCPVCQATSEVRERFRSFLRKMKFQESVELILEH